MSKTYTEKFSDIVINEVLPAIAKSYCAVGLEQERFANLKGRKKAAENLLKRRSAYLRSIISKYIEAQEAFCLSLSDRESLLENGTKRVAKSQMCQEENSAFKKE